MKYAWCLFLIMAWTGYSQPAVRPNVLLICVDDLKPLLGCYGSPIVKTPNIDRLAARGVLFERAFANQAVCAPSRNALMTGLRPQTIGIYDLSTNFRESVPEAVTLAQTFMRNGYRTEAMGKIMHVGHGNHEDDASWSVPHFQAKTVGYALPENRAAMTREGALFANQKGVSSLPRGAPTECADVSDSTYADGQIADEAIRRLHDAKAKTGQPWFMGVGFLKPHLPFCAPKKYWDLYRPEEFRLPSLKELPEGAPAFAGHNSGELRNYSDIPKVGPVDDAMARRLIHGYHAATSYMDAQLGRVLDALEETGLSATTVVVLWGDHGWHLGDHGLWCKHTNYEQAAHIPLIVSAPGVTPFGGRSSSLVETVDIYPTLCELAGLVAPQGLDGTSFAATLRQPSAPTKEAVYHVYPREDVMGRAVRTARHRLVEWRRVGAPAESAVYELYDYERDPEETRNVASENPGVVGQLRALLARQQEPRPQVKAKAAAGAAGAVRPKQDRAAVFASRDVDRDGQLTREEFLRNQPDPGQAPKRFEAFDSDGNGVLSIEEFVRAGRR